MSDAVEVGQPRIGAETGSGRPGAVARAAEASGDWATAAAEWRVAVSDHPANARFKIRAARALLELGEFVQTEHLLSSDIVAGSSDPSIIERAALLRVRCSLKRARAAEGEFNNGWESVDWLLCASHWRQAADLSPDKDQLWINHFRTLAYAMAPEAAEQSASSMPPRLQGDHRIARYRGAATILGKQAIAEPRIFGEAALPYLERGFPVIPAVGKKPFPQPWRQFAYRPPEQKEYAAWLDIPFANIGMVLGPQSGIAAVDIDTDDPVLINVMRSVLPPSPWCRVGSKGMALAYRWGGLGEFSISHPDGSRIVDFLSTESHLVLPPSIHFTAGRPYRADRPLLDVVGDLVAQPKDLPDRLFNALAATGCDPRFVPLKTPGGRSGLPIMTAV